MTAPRHHEDVLDPQAVEAGDEGATGREHELVDQPAGAATPEASADSPASPADLPVAVEPLALPTAPTVLMAPAASTEPTDVAPEPTPATIPATTATAAAAPATTGPLDAEQSVGAPRVDHGDALVNVEPDARADVLADAAFPDGADSGPPPSAAGSRSGWSSRRALLAVAVVVLAAVVGTTLFVRGRGLPDDAAFAYGDKVVSEAALSRHVELLKALYGLVPPAEGAPEADRFRRDAAKSLAVSMVIERAAADRHVVVADRVVDDTLARFVERQYPEGRASFLSALGEQGVNEAAVRGEVARQVQVRRLYDQVTKDAAVTPQEVRAAYDKDPAAFALPPLRDVREIVVRTKEEAVALLGRLRAGADFTEAARTQSLDSSTSTQGGALGKVARVQLDETFGPAAFSARVGDYFGPVPSPQGYSYVGKVVSEDPARQRPFAEVRQEVEDQLLEAERAGLWRDFLRDRIKAAHVEYADAYRPADPGAAPSDVLPSAPLGTAASAGPTGSAAPFVGPTR